MWTRVLHHVVGELTWVFGGCEHTPLTDNRDKPWMQKDSKAHLKLAEVILNECWLKSVYKYLTFRSVCLSGCYYSGIYRYTITLATDHMDTVLAWKEMGTNILQPAFQCYRSSAKLESFHNHILMYAGKHSGTPPPPSSYVWSSGPAGCPGLQPPPLDHLSKFNMKPSCALDM